MSPRWTRLMIAFAAALAVWAIALPASAAAPMCDPRGATTDAPAPQLQQPATSIDVGTAPEDCDELSALATAFNDGRAPSPAPASAAQDHLLPNVAPAVHSAGCVDALARGSSEGSARAGERGRVDRPPRLAD